MLSGKQTRYLRSLAHSLRPIFQVGKGGVSPTMIDHLSLALEKRELIKVSVLQNADESIEDAANIIATGTKAEIVQLIGRTIILFRPSTDNKTIELPR